MKHSLEDLRCVHRHTIYDHPACFAKGLIKSPKDIPWHEDETLKIGYLDIETDGLQADFGSMLTWCIKPKGIDKVDFSVITKKEIFKGVYDKRLVRDLVDAIRQYNIIITYNGTNFDVPFARAKALHYGLDFPDYGDVYHWDLYYSVKSLLRISRKSLDNACDYLGIQGKTPIEKEVWRKAKYGDSKAIATVLVHNVGDVVILEQLHDKLTNFRKWTKRSV